MTKREEKQEDADGYEEGLVQEKADGFKESLAKKETDRFESGIEEMVSIKELPEYVKAHAGADVTADCANRFLRYYHYTRSGTDLYLFANEDIRNRIQTKVTLSAFSGGNYILYDAFENRACAKFSEDGKIDLDLPPYHTVFILCNEATGQEVSDAMMPAENLCAKHLRVERPWTDRLWEDSDLTVVEEENLEPVFRVSVAKEPDPSYEEYRITKELFNVTGSGELPYFSGNIRYESTVEIKEEGNYLLDLGQVGEAADLYINGKCAGSKIVPPYVFDVSGFIRKGSNEICVMVSNHNGYEKRDRFSKFLLFEASGLLGPITLKRYTDGNL